MGLRVVIADDEDLVRSGIRMIVGAAGDMEVVGEAEDGARAVQVVRDTLPDVVLMDVHMPGVNGLAAARRITDTLDGVHVLMLTTFDRDEYVYDAMRDGASGFLLKSTPPEQLLNAIRVVADGQTLLAPSITRRLVEDFVRRPAPGQTRPPELDALTERELEVLALIAEGLGNPEIAARLVLSEATVKSHVNRIFTKLAIRSRAQAVVLAYESGLVRPGERPPG